MKNNTLKNNWLSQLNPNVSDLLTSPDLSEKLDKLLIKYGFVEEVDKDTLAADQKGEKLIEIVLKTLKGVLPLENLNKIVERELNTNSITAEKIMIDLNQEIFSNIRTSLKKMPETAVSEEKTIPPTKTVGIVLPKTPAIKQKPDIYREKTE